MPRARIIKAEFFRNEVLGHLPPIARLTFAGLWTLADREGRLQDRPGRIKVDLFPYDTVLTDEEVNGYLEIFDRCDLIVRYVVDDEPLIQIVKWRKHQRPHPREVKSDLPEPPENARQTRNENLGSSKANPRFAKGEQLQSGSSEISEFSGSSEISGSSGSSRSRFAGKTPSSSSRKKRANIDREVVAGVFAFWQKTMNSPRSKLDEKREKAIRDALAMGYTPHQLGQAIRGCSRTPHNMGDNDRHQPYNGIALILRDADHIDRFIRNDENPPAKVNTLVNGVAAHNEAAAAAYLARDGNSLAGDPMTIDMEH
ncbi:hypothetical protein [Paraburkholderia graminis]|nr:hypothetical protein [Paraburkholderia graminis]